MITINRYYHFYAAHRNETLNDKCRNIHGHTYDVTVELSFKNPEGSSGVTVLFSDIDKVVEPIIKKLDHSFLINAEDPIYEALIKADPSLYFYVFNCTTSVENIAATLWLLIKESGLPCTGVGVAETKSAVVWYRP